MQCGNAAGVVAAHGVSDNVDALEPEGIPECREVVDERLPRVVVAVGALAVTALVEHEHPVTGGTDPLDDGLVRLRVQEHAVEEHDDGCRRITPFLIPEARAVQVEEVSVPTAG